MTDLKLWTPDDFGRFANLSPDQVKKLRVSGDGPPYVAIGRNIRYVPGQVVRWLEKKQQTSTRDNR